jgi:hypothetical protein
MTRRPARALLMSLSFALMLVTLTMARADFSFVPVNFGWACAPTSATDSSALGLSDPPAAADEVLGRPAANQSERMGSR